MDIKLAKNDKRYIEGTDDVYNIMKSVLLRDNKIDQEKEHFCDIFIVLIMIFVLVFLTIYLP